MSLPSWVPSLTTSIIIHVLDQDQSCWDTCGVKQVEFKIMISRNVQTKLALEGNAMIKREREKREQTANALEALHFVGRQLTHLAASVGAFGTFVLFREQRSLEPIERILAFACVLERIFKPHAVTSHRRHCSDHELLRQPMVLAQQLNLLQRDRHPRAIFCTLAGGHTSRAEKTTEARTFLDDLWVLCPHDLLLCGFDALFKGRE